MLTPRIQRVLAKPAFKVQPSPLTLQHRNGYKILCRAAPNKAQLVAGNELLELWRLGNTNLGTALSVTIASCCRGDLQTYWIRAESIARG